MATAGDPTGSDGPTIWRSRAWLPLSILIAVGLAIALGAGLYQERYGTTVETWSQADGDTSYVFEDTYRKFDHAIVSRRVWMTVKANRDSPAISGIATGPMTESGKRHGHWHMSLISSQDLHGEDSWYWYGDKVSEGEWHRLSGT